MKTGKAIRWISRVPIWAAIFATLAILAAVVTVAVDSGREALRARSAQLEVVRLQLAAENVDRFSREAMMRAYSGAEPAAVARESIPAGFRIWNRMSAQMREVERVAPGHDTELVRRSFARVYRRGLAAARDTRNARSSVAARTRFFVPVLAEMHRDISALSVRLDMRAESATRRAVVAGAVGVGGGTAALLVLGLLVTSLRRRARHSERLREIERRSDERIRALIEHAGDVVTVLDPGNQRIKWVASSVEQLIGTDAESTVGRSLWEIVHPEDEGRVRASLDRSRGRDDAELVSCRLRHRDGGWIWAEAVAQDRSSDPAVEGVLLSLRNVTDRRRLEDRLRHQAYHDSLTGLANRVMLEERLEGALRVASGGPGSTALLYLDIDDFKTINDSLGHEVGDELLQRVARRVAAVLRPGDLAARLGGDEFAVLLREVVNEDEARSVARDLLRELEPEFRLGDRSLSVTSSVGIVVDDGSSGVAEMLRNADLAMYAAKERGSGSLSVFAQELHERVVERLELSNRLPAAIERGELVLDYQPIVDLADARIRGVEALVRWAHPERGRLSPDAFVPLAEETGSIVELGRWVLREACTRGAAIWPGDESSADDGYISVNVSIKQLDDPRFPDDVERIVSETGFPAERLVLEITESVLVQDRAEALDQLARLKAIGVSLAIDDFGVGYSVLSYLQDFPVDVLKIDRSFVDRLHVDSERAKVVTGIVELADRLGLRTVAEGIEEPGQADALRLSGAQFGQGYLFSRPVTFEQLEALIDEDCERDRRTPTT